MWYQDNWYFGALSKEPIYYRRIDFEDLEQMKSFYKNRFVRDLYQTSSLQFTWNAKKWMYDLHAKFTEDHEDAVLKQHAEEKELEASEFAMGLYFSKILNFGRDMNFFAQKVHAMDGDYPKETENKSITRETINQELFQEICNNRWECYRDNIFEVKNRYTRPVRVLVVWDGFTSKIRVEDDVMNGKIQEISLSDENITVQEAFEREIGGDIRFFTTSEYIRQPTLECLEVLEKAITSMGDGLTFHSGYATAFKDVVTYLRDETITDDEGFDTGIQMGITMETSEVGGSALKFSGSLYFPNVGLSLHGITVTKKVRLTHRTTKFEDDPIEKTNGKSAEEKRLEWFMNAQRVAIREILTPEAIREIEERVRPFCRAEMLEIGDYEERDDKGDILLQKSLKIRKNKDFNFLIEIHEREGYPRNLEGIVYAMLHHANKTKELTDDERGAWQRKALEFIEDPEKFYKDMGIESSRAHHLEL